jgi:hypothetical protein
MKYNFDFIDVKTLRLKGFNVNGISLSKRLENEDLLLSEIESVLTPENLEQYIKEADISLPCRCIDGRIDSQYKSTSVTRKLAPKLPGGSVHAAVAYRISKLMSSISGSIEDDLSLVIEIFGSRNIGIGDHIDDHSSLEKSGCGALDNLSKIISIISDKNNHRQLTEIISMLNNQLDNNILMEVFDNFKTLDQASNHYLDDNYKRDVISLLRATEKNNLNPVPKLSGAHNEIALILNYASGTTIDNDRFSFNYKNKLQLFGWDIWQIQNEANALLGGSKNIKERNMFIAARCLLGAATLMVLSDGSVNLITVT